MRFKGLFMLLVFALAATGLAAFDSEGGVIDRVVAYVDNDALLQSELMDNYRKATALYPDISLPEVLRTMINRKLLLLEAKKIFPDTLADEEGLIGDYIDLRLRAFIKLPEQEVRAYYEEHPGGFGGRQFEDAKEEIELLLEEREVNRRLQAHIEEMRAKKYIRILLD